MLALNPQNSSLQFQNQSNQLLPSSSSSISALPSSSSISILTTPSISVSTTSSSALPTSTSVSALPTSSSTSINLLNTHVSSTLSNSIVTKTKSRFIKIPLPTVKPSISFFSTKKTTTNLLNIPTSTSLLNNPTSNTLLNIPTSNTLQNSPISSTSLSNSQSLTTTLSNSQSLTNLPTLSSTHLTPSFSNLIINSTPQSPLSTPSIIPEVNLKNNYSPTTITSNQILISSTILILLFILSLLCCCFFSTFNNKKDILENNKNFIHINTIPTFITKDNFTKFDTIKKNNTTIIQNYQSPTSSNLLPSPLDRNISLNDSFENSISEYFLTKTDIKSNKDTESTIYSIPEEISIPTLSHQNQIEEEKKIIQENDDNFFKLNNIEKINSIKSFISEWYLNSEALKVDVKQDLVKNTFESQDSLGNLSETSDIQFDIQIAEHRRTKYNSVYSDISINEITPPQLSVDFSNQFFYLNPSKNAYTFHTPILPDGAASTTGSDTTRTELRESPFGFKNGIWNPQIGTHSLKLTQSIDKLPNVPEPGVVTAQIHNGVVPVLIIRLTSNQLSAFFPLAPNTGHTVINGNYQLGTQFSLELRVVQGKMYVLQDDQVLTDCGGVSLSDQGVFFKTGSYNQNHLTSPESASMSSDVSIYSATIVHDANLNVKPTKCVFRLSGLAIAGIVTASILLLLSICVGFCCYVKRKNKDTIPKVYGGFRDANYYNQVDTENSK